MNSENIQYCIGCNFTDTSLLLNLCPTVLSHNTLVFLSIIEIVLRSQLSLADPCRRAKTLDDVNSPEFDKHEFDFIIVGGGVAGAVLAGRLSENPKHEVLLLEAGTEEPTASSVPLFAFSAQNTLLDWQYETVPQKNACLSTGGICSWPRGKMICGTACLSGSMHTRGSPSIYNSWEKAGNVGWNYQDVLHFFKKYEHNTEPSDKIDPEYHGFNGPMPVGRYPYSPFLAKEILSAAQEIGYKILDVNGKSQSGFTIAPVMVQDGARASTSRMYLRPVKIRKNLQVMIDSYVVKIDFNEAKNRTTGVQYRDKWGNLRKVRARKEVIVSGGVVGSAQLLLLSGIGPKEHLKKVNIETIKDLPVGQNLHHHFGLGCKVKIATPFEQPLTLKSLYEYINNRSGPFAGTGMTQVTAFLESSNTEKGIPDIQLFIDGFNAKCTKFFESNITSIDFRPVYLLTKCRGHIKLKSNNPFEKPEIEPNYLCNETEIESLVEAIRMLQKLVQTDTLKKYILEFDAENHEACNNFPSDSDDYWKCVIRQYTLGENHHAGTCKMGLAEDKTSVVDAKLRVHGISNLRVIDASVMPTPINANPIGPIIMIAEKGAHMILND